MSNNVIKKDKKCQSKLNNTNYEMLNTADICEKATSIHPEPSATTNVGPQEFFYNTVALDDEEILEDL